MPFRMKSFSQVVLSVTRVFGWLPQIVKLSQNRYRAQVRLFALAALWASWRESGAIGFYLATRSPSITPSASSPATIPSLTRRRNENFLADKPRQPAPVLGCCCSFRRSVAC